MKVLVVLAQPPIPEGSAPGRCAVGLLRGLREHGVEVSVLVARQFLARAGVPVFGVPRGVPPELPVEVVPILPQSSRAIPRLRRPWAELRTGSFAARLRELASDVDAVHLDQTALTFSADGVTTPALMHVHSFVRKDVRLGLPWSRDFVLGCEHLLADRAAARRPFVAASSARVASLLRRSARNNEVIVAPLSVDPSAYKRAPLDGPPTAGIIGTGDWPPTVRAVSRLVDRVWPLVRRAVPEARLIVAGRRMTGRFEPTPPPGVDFVGEVDSAAEFLSGLSLLLYPLDRGTGMKVKVLESMASGLPVVTTSDGAEGVESNVGVVVETDDDALATAASRILRDIGERRERGAVARETFERLYAPVPATEPLIDLYRRMAGG